MLLTRRQTTHYSAEKDSLIQKDLKMPQVLLQTTPPRCPGPQLIQWNLQTTLILWMQVPRPML